MAFVPNQPVLQLITSCLYPSSSPNKPPQEAHQNGMEVDGEDHLPMPGSLNGSLNGHVNGHAAEVNGRLGDERLKLKSESPYTHESAPLIGMFRAEFCRRHEWPKEDPLEVVVDLGSRGGALNAIEKARRVMGERLGPIRTWEELPVSQGEAGLRHAHT